MKIQIPRNSIGIYFTAQMSKCKACLRCVFYFVSGAVYEFFELRLVVFCLCTQLREQGLVLLVLFLLEQAYVLFLIFYL